MSPLSQFATEVPESDFVGRTGKILQAGMMCVDKANGEKAIKCFPFKPDISPPTQKGQFVHASIVFTGQSENTVYTSCIVSFFPCSSQIVT